jgi:hypothetical protein
MNSKTTTMGFFEQNLEFKKMKEFYDAMNAMNRKGTERLQISE